MAKYIFQLILLISTLQAGASGFKAKVDSAVSLISIDLHQSHELSELWLKEAIAEEDLFGIIKLNFVLGYISKEQGNFGQGAIYYLEALRWSANGSYDGIEKDIIAFHKNLANIYKKFSHFELATKHYDIAIGLALQVGDFGEYGSIVYSISSMLSNRGKEKEALTNLKSTYNYFDKIDNRRIALIYNKVGLLETSLGNYSQARINFEKLINFIENKEKLRKRFLGIATHNIGDSYMQEGDLKAASIYFLNALDIHKTNKAHSSMFLSAKDLGETYLHLNDYVQSKKYLLLAESLNVHAKRHEHYYEVYKLLGSLFKEKGDFLKSSQYHEIYSSKLEEFLNEQHAIEQNDKKYNLDLITQRYFAMVAEQERNAQLTYYSTVGAASLVSVILLILAYFQLRKYRLKRTLEDALRPFTESI